MIKPTNAPSNHSTCLAPSSAAYTSFIASINTWNARGVKTIMKSCKCQRFGLSRVSRTPRVSTRKYGRLAPRNLIVAGAEASKTQESDLIPISADSDLDAWPAIEDLEQLQDDVNLLNSFVDDMDDSVNVSEDEEEEEGEERGSSVEDSEIDDDSLAPAHGRESSWDGMGELPDQKIETESDDGLWEGRRQHQSLNEGLKFVDEAEKDVHAEAELAEMLEAVQKRKSEKETMKRRVAWGESKKKDRLRLLSEMEIVEESPERAQFHKLLFSAAKKGKPALAEMTIQDMFSAGVLPGPKAYHGVIFAYVKAEDPDGALGAIRRAHNAGVVPITESYLILIHAFIKDSNLKTAEAILASMKRAGADAYRGWTMMIRSLLGEGNLTAAKQHLKLGKEHQWWPDSELYEVLMQDLCKRKLSYQAKRLMSEIEKNVGTITIRHASPYLDLISRAEKTALKTVLKAYSAVKSPDLIMYNALLRAYLRSWTGTRDESKSFMRTWVQMTHHYIPSMASHILMIRAQLNMGNVKEAAELLINNKVCACVGEDRKDLADTILPDLLNGLSEANLPLNLIRVLQALALDGYNLTEETLTLNSKGNTFVTIWLQEHLRNFKKRLESGNIGSKPVMEMGTRIFRFGDYEVDLGFCNCAVDSEGIILAVSKMSGLQMAAELESRGVVTDTMTKPELAREIRISRSAWPAIADEIKRKRRMKSKRVKMERNEQEARVKDVIGPPDRYDTDTKAGFITYGRGHIADEQKLSKEEIAQQLEDAILEAEEKYSNRAQNLAAAEAAEEDESNPYKQKVGEGDESTFPAADEASKGGSSYDIDNLDSGSEYKEQPFEVWQDTLELDSAYGAAKSQIGTEGVMTSVKICELLQSMAQICSLEDFEMIVEGILLEESPASALAMAKLISTSVTTVSLPSVIWSEEKVSKQAKQIAYKERLSRAFTKCARICFDQGYPDSSAEVMKVMLESGMSPQSELAESVRQKRGISAPNSPIVVRGLAPAPQIADDASKALGSDKDTANEIGAIENDSTDDNRQLLNG